MLLPCIVTSYIFSESNGLNTPNAGGAWITLALERKSDVIGVVNIPFFGSHRMVTSPFFEMGNCIKKSISFSCRLHIPFNRVGGL